MLFVPSLTQWVTSQVAIVHDGMVDMFLFRKGSSLIAIDSGYRPMVVRKALKRLNLDPETVTHLFLTHSDFDHTGALSVFPNAKLLMGSTETVMTDQKVRRIPIRYNNPLPRPVRLLHDGERVEVAGIEVHAISTPGHTPGSTSWLVEGRHLFVGDALMLSFGKAHIMPACINMDTPMHRESLHQLASRILAPNGDDPLRCVKCLFTAHSGYTVDVGRALQHWKEGVQW